MRPAAVRRRVETAAEHASLVCTVCGYGVARRSPPGPCPMCRTEVSWASSYRRPFHAPHAVRPAEAALEAGL